ncbi:MAG: aminotransferase class III-fold pyridoxal phosphate-dependent enzyme, partial [Gammaproteobacteria bacterium]
MRDEEILAIRKRHFGRGLSLSYRQPLTIVRAEGQYLYDSSGKRFLDCINNVCHVGHCHPHVVKAISDQTARLNTNTRFLHPLLAEYVTQLAARFPEPLKVIYLVNSGSEATDLALRLAKCYSGANDVIALEGAYHGHTQAALDVSHYKFAGPGGAGCPSATHVVPMPCTYRGEYRDKSCAGAEYSTKVVEKIAEMMANDNPPAAFIAESLLSVGGQV